jgi:hypothetical protein
VGLSHLGRDKEGGKTVDFVPKEKILHDIQFRGAISDFYVLKSKVPWKLGWYRSSSAFQDTMNVHTLSGPLRGLGEFSWDALGYFSTP